MKAGKEKTGIDVVQWAKQAVGLGAGEVLLTRFVPLTTPHRPTSYHPCSWDRDGTKSGYDLELLKAVSAAVNVPVIASGGAATADHLADGLASGADAVLAASIFHYGEFTVKELKDELFSRGIAVRY